MTLLAADIGGTKTLLLLADQSQQGLQVIREFRYDNSLYPSLESVVDDFLREVSHLPRPEIACFGVAGPVKDNKAVMTNLAWEIDGHKLSQTLSIPTIKLLNDFSCIAYGIDFLTEAQLSMIQQGNTTSSAPVVILGAGTGLGVTTRVTSTKGDISVIESEGGHIDFAATTPQQYALLCFLQKKYDGRISIERLLSGEGLINIFEFLLASNPTDKDYSAEANKIATKDASFIAQLANQGDEAAQQTLSLFSEIYGAQAGNLALVNLAKGGVYIAGGIVEKIYEQMDWHLFLEAFSDKGRMSPLLKDMAVHVILEPKVGLYGAAMAAQQLSNDL